MTEATPDPIAGHNPSSELSKFALAATERNMALTRSWSDALLTTLKEQAENTRTTLKTLAASLEAMERALASQEETNRALRQSLEGYRQIIDRYAAAGTRADRLPTPRARTPDGIVKLFGNACGAVDVSGLGGDR